MDSHKHDACQLLRQLLRPQQALNIIQAANRNEDSFWQIINGMGGRKPEAFRLRWEGMTYPKMSKAMGVSRQYCGQMVKDVIAHLVHPAVIDQWCISNTESEQANG